MSLFLGLGLFLGFSSRYYEQGYFPVFFLSMFIMRVHKKLLICMLIFYSDSFFLVPIKFKSFLIKTLGFQT